MKKISIILGLYLGLIVGLSQNVAAQTCGSVDWLNQRVIPDVSIEILNTSGQPVSSLNPSTNYTLRIRSTGGTCGVSGSGCSSGFAPVAFVVIFASGCTIDGRTIPPETTGRDVGSSNNYTANLNLRTLSSGSFGGQVLVLVRALGTEVGVCALKESTAFASFDSLNDL